MAFSVYSSLKSVPSEMREVAKVYRWSPWQRLVQMGLPFAAIGLVWNSMVSVATAWFYLMACEMFVLGKRDFRLLGLGSYLQAVANAADTRAIIWGLIVLIGVIVAMDQVDRADASGNAVVNPVQRHRRRDRPPDRLERGLRCLQVREIGAMAKADFAGNLPLFDHRFCYRFGGRLECEHPCRILSFERPDFFDDRIGRGGQ